MGTNVEDIDGCNRMSQKSGKAFGNDRFGCHRARSSFAGLFCPPTAFVEGILPPAMDGRQPSLTANHASPLVAYWRGFDYVPGRSTRSSVG